MNRKLVIQAILLLFMLFLGIAAVDSQALSAEREAAGIRLPADEPSTSRHCSEGLLRCVFELGQEFDPRRALAGRQAD